MSTASKNWQNTLVSLIGGKLRKGKTESPKGQSVSVDNNQRILIETDQVTIPQKAILANSVALKHNQKPVMQNRQELNLRDVKRSCSSSLAGYGFATEEYKRYFDSYLDPKGNLELVSKFGETVDKNQ